MYKENFIAKNVANTQNRVKVKRASYIDGYRILITFTDDNQKVVDFNSYIEAKALGFYSKYKKLENFRNFKVENGNVVWGKNWDLIFPIDQLYKGKIE